MKFKLLFFCILIFSIIGQLEEIKTQTIVMGGIIKQNCLINSIGPTGLSTIIPCPDCVAYMSISDPEGIFIVTNRQLISQSISINGATYNNYQFGFSSNPSEFEINKEYDTLTYCYSNTFGNGTASGKLIIVNNKNQLPSLSTSLTLPSINFGDSNSSFFDPITSRIDNLIASFSDLKTTMSKIKNFVVTVALTFNDIFLSYMKLVHDIAINVLLFLGINPDPNNISYVERLGPIRFNNKVILPFIINIITDLIVIDFFIFLFIEVCIIGLTIILNDKKHLDGFELFWVYLKYNYMFLLILLKFPIWLIKTVRGSG